ncbi:hypothetical protein [Corynebacterium stationis]|uniref:hypothetical protein n=1 Tax=Corynebacterium stationis TaxID=1705 RepID=UPI0028AC11B6|nr:hypothetical protein [Corynebacterium stationis]
MTNLTGDLRSIMGTPFGGVGHAVLIFSRVTRAAFDSDSVILQLHDRIDMPEDANGKFRIDNLDPGPVRVELEGGTVHNHGWNIDLPDEGTWSLAVLVDAQVDWSPAVIGRAEAAARDSRNHADRAEAAADRVGTAEQVGVWAGEASASAAAAATSEANAARSESNASGYEQAAGGHADRAESAADVAASDAVGLVRSELDSLVDDAGVAKAAAGVSEVNAAQSADDASGFAELAEQYKTAAEQYKNDAAQSKADAALSASSADTDAGAAAASATGAAQSESSAATHAQNALAHAGQSEDARDESRLARDEAVQAAENAQQGSPPEGWKKSELAQPVQDSLSRADTALQSVPVATESAPGTIRLSGDLGGTSQAPTVPGLADKADSVHTHEIEQVTGLDGELQALRDLIHARHAFFSGEGAPVDIPYAVVGDYYFDETSQELHKITGV